MVRIAVAAILSVAACGAVSAGFVSVPTKPNITKQAEHVAYRHCWRQHGVRHCQWAGDANRIYRYGAGSPDDYRVGTAEWYRAMEREDRLNKPSRGR
jgi:hypothetical protein